MKLAQDYYLGNDVVHLSKDLLGKVLLTRIQGKLTSGIICETEAYNGVVDKASHAYGDRRTKRTETIYKKGGIAYVYLCYGIHHLFNVVTNKEETPHAILIRGIFPLKGKEFMVKRKNISNYNEKMGIGPGNVTKCLGIRTQMDGLNLRGNKIWLEDQGIKVDSKKIIVGPRIGVDYAEEDAQLPYRFQYTFS